LVKLVTYFMSYTIKTRHPLAFERAHKNELDMFAVQYKGIEAVYIKSRQSGRSYIETEDGELFEVFGDAIKDIESKVIVKL